MATKRPAADENQVQLATRIPRRLLLSLRVHCVKNETTMMQFIGEAIEEKLKALRGK